MLNLNHCYGRPAAERRRNIPSNEHIMRAAVKTEHPHIVHVDGLCGGEPVIDGLRVAVRHVVTLHQQGEAIVDIAEALGITEAQVFHALSYFFDHRDEIMELIARDEQADARFAEP